MPLPTRPNKIPAQQQALKRYDTIHHTDGPPPGNDARRGPGNGKNRGRIGERTNEAWQDQKAGFYYAVVAALLKVGFTEAEIGKVGGGNFCRVFDAATAGHS